MSQPGPWGRPPVPRKPSRIGLYLWLALMWGKMAKVSLGKDDKLHKDKLMCARYWMERMVPECPMLLERIQAGSQVVMELD